MNNRNAGRSSAGGLGRSPSNDDHGPDTNRVLIVSDSPINRIVIARTLERIYLKPQAVASSAALKALNDSRPVMVIIDGPAQGIAFGPLLSELAKQRGASERNLPRTVLIDGPAQRSDTPPAGLIDAVAIKPITPDVLQPVVERLVRDIRGA
ncbi:response regulator [Chelativorans xinjiangense]|uniref:response regulator n=1 Tax=Chelativorans xinjiangense TaxID=2681485 RepID=UPI0013591263|nr:response regulator [Chelativorans xinjiangense]